MMKPKPKTAPPLPLSDAALEALCDRIADGPPYGPAQVPPGWRGGLTGLYDPAKLVADGWPARRREHQRRWARKQLLAQNAGEFPGRWPPNEFTATSRRTPR